MIEYESLYLANKPFMKEYEEKFSQLLKTGWFVLGQAVEQFEKDFTQYHGLKNFIGVASGLDALIISLDLCKFPQGAEIIVPANTYIATIFAIIRAGHVPVLVEPDIATYNIDAKKIEAAITPKTKALIIVHLYGKPCEMDEIMKIKKKYGLILIEDCAQAHGAKYNNQLVGTFGEFAAFSFYPTKNLGALGDAGGIAFTEFVHADTVKKIRNYGSNVKYVFDLVGYNSRLDEVHAAFLSIKLKKLNDINAKKRQLAEIYLNEIRGEFILPQNSSKYSQVYHIFNIRHPDRDKLKTFLMSKNIKTEIHYPISPHRQKALEHLGLKDFPISDLIHSTTLSLPISWFHSEEDVRTVTRALNQF